MACLDGGDGCPVCVLRHGWQKGGVCDAAQSDVRLCLDSSYDRDFGCRQLNVPFPEKLADGHCDEANNVPGCWDNYDCCPSSCGFFGNGTKCGRNSTFDCLDPLFRLVPPSCGSDPRLSNGVCDCDLNTKGKSVCSLGIEFHHSCL